VTRYYFLSEGYSLKVAVLFLWGAVLATAKQTPGARIRRREITGKHAVNIVMKHAQTWNFDANGGEKLCQKSIQQSTSTTPK
jgi:hypothetical protein